MRTLLSLVVISLWLFAASMSIYGLVLAFSASVVVGIVALVVQPLPLIFGLVMFFGHVDLAQRIATALGLS